MKGKTSISLLVAVTLGLVTAKVGWDLLANYRMPANADEMTRVLTSRIELEPGHIIEAEDLSSALVPAGTVPESAFTESKELVGRTVITQIVAGQIMFDGLVTDRSSPGGLQALVPEGMRAVTVEVNESSGVAGLLVPGCRVDVIATLRRGDETIARTIVENVRVTAVGRRLVRDSREDARGTPVRTVTLVMSPKNAEAIELAGTHGRPRLVLRGTADNSPTASPGVTLAELVSGGTRSYDPFVASYSGGRDDAFASANVARPNDPNFQNSFIRRPVQIIRGGHESTIYYEVRAVPANASQALDSGNGTQLPADQ